MLEGGVAEGDLGGELQQGIQDDSQGMRASRLHERAVITQESPESSKPASSGECAQSGTDRRSFFKSLAADIKSRREEARANEGFGENFPGPLCSNSDTPRLDLSSFRLNTWHEAMVVNRPISQISTGSSKQDILEAGIEHSRPS